MRKTPLEERIESVVIPVLEDMEFRLVRVLLTGEGRSLTLQIMAEPVDKELSMNVESCADISRELSAILDVDDPIDEKYTLEVSSPGIDRPLTRPQDFVDFIGSLARIEIDPPFEGRKKFKGEIVSADASEGLTLEMVNGDQIDINFAAVVKAKLMFDEKLLQTVKI